MIGRIRGTLVARAPDVIEVLTPGGIGYEIQVPLTLLDRLGGIGDDVELHTVLVVRDDALELYGFESERDRTLFRRLRTASGVGPRLALAILGALPTERVVGAIRDRDHRTLQTVSGVGRKTAERITLELADKLDDLGAGLAPPAVGGSPRAAVQALRALGYAQGESDDAVRRAVAALDGRDIDVEELVKQALRFL